MTKLGFLYLIPPRVFKPANGPLGIAYIASYLEKHLGITETWIDIDVDHLIAAKPDIVGICSFSWSYTLAQVAARKIKDTLNVPIMIGGPHISAIPQGLDPAMDVGVLGEGEETVAELMQLYLEDKWSPEYFKHIKSVVYHDQGYPKITLKREVIQNLDDLPPPKRSILKAYDPRQKREIEWYQGLNTSRGCPFTCQYCIHSSLLEKVRFHSTERIISEIEEIIQFYPHTSNSTFHDELFALSKKRLSKLVQAIEEKGLQKKIGFNCMTRANMFDEDMADLMKRMNMELVGFGFETNSQRVLDFLKVGNVTVEDHLRVLGICETFELNVSGYFIIGSSLETLYDLSETYWFIRLNLYRMVNFVLFNMTPFPGNALWNRYLSRGLVSNEMEDWSVLDYDFFRPEHNIFVNEVYSLKDFSYAYSHFEVLNKVNYLTANIQEQINAFNQYQNKLFPMLNQLIQSQSILEITPYKHGILKRHDIPAQQIHPHSLAKLEQQTFDYILINHSLEQIRHPQQWLEQLKSYSSGTIICLIYNSLNLQFLQKLLLGEWSDPMKDYKEVDYWKNYTFFTATRLFKDSEYQLINSYDYQPNDLHIANQRLMNSKGFKELLPFLEQFISLKRLKQTLNIFSHILVFEPLSNPTTVNNSESSVVQIS